MMSCFDKIFAEETPLEATFLGCGKGAYAGLEAVGPAMSPSGPTAS